MIELPMIFVAGFLGSSHCIGMCGPFALLIGASKGTVGSGLARQLTYSLGRLFTYTALGAIAGFCGVQLSGSAARLVNVPALLSVVAGCVLIFQGLSTAGVVRLGSVKGASTCLAGGLLSNFLRSKRRLNIFLAGLFTGFLPCGLVYGFLGMAASSRGIGNGAAIMAAFGAGTIPIMVVTGVGGGLLTTATRGRLLRLAAWCVVLVGALALVRGLSFLAPGDNDPVSACPLCG